jgi:hypothetical protein
MREGRVSLLYAHLFEWGALHLVTTTAIAKRRMDGGKIKLALGILNARGAAEAAARNALTLF